MFIWARDFGDNIPKALNEGHAFIGGASGDAHVSSAQLRHHRPVREYRQGSLGQQAQHEAHGLLTGQGTVLGHAFGPICHL